MPLDSVGTLVQLLQQNRLLEPKQLDELAGAMQAQYTDVRLLLRELCKRDWLTPYQANQLYHTGGKDLVLGKYVLLGKVGEGPMGQDYKAKHRLMNRLVALKVIRPELLARPEAVQKFYEDTQSASQLDHKHIVHAYDAGPVGQTHFFAMEFVEGTDLDKLVTSAGPPPLPLICEFLRQTALGLQNAHELGILHQDLRPANLLVTRSSNMAGANPSDSWRSLMNSEAGGGPIIKIQNLGLTLLRTAHARDAGAVDYIAPERTQPGAKLDARCDLYSLGAAYYFVLTGRPPFPGGTAQEKLRRHVGEEPVPVNLLRKDASPQLVAVVAKLMAKRPEKRFQTAAEVAPAMKGITS